MDLSNSYDEDILRYYHMVGDEYLKLRKSPNNENLKYILTRVLEEYEAELELRKVDISYFKNELRKDNNFYFKNKLIKENNENNGTK